MLVHRLLNPLGFAVGQLADFQGASEVSRNGVAPCEGRDLHVFLMLTQMGSRRTEKQPTDGARRVALKMGRLGETYRRIGGTSGSL